MFFSKRKVLVFNLYQIHNGLCSFQPKSGLPEVRALAPEPIHVLENHFAVPHGKTDLLKPPKHYPAPVMRYTLREMSVVWHMYGGHDFGPVKGTSNAPIVKKRVHINDGTEWQVSYILSFTVTGIIVN